MAAATQTKPFPDLQKNPGALIKAKFPGKCSWTGQSVKAGDLVFYNPERKTVQLAVKYTPDSPAGFVRSVIKILFDNWVNHPQNKDARSYYFEAAEELDFNTYGSVAGAIEEAMDNIHEQMCEEQVSWCWLNNVDIEASFQF